MGFADRGGVHGRWQTRRAGNFAAESRAIFKLLGPCAGLAESANDLLLLGLLSAMDAILDMRVPDVLREIAIREEIRDALLGKVNALRDICELVLHYEPGYWEEIGSAAIRLGMSEDAVPALYLESVD